MCLFGFSKKSRVENFLLARILSKQKSPETEEAWRALIEHNPDSYEYYRGYLKYMGIDDGAPILTYLTCTSSWWGPPDQVTAKALEKLGEFAVQLPKANAPVRLQLNIASGETFKKLVEPYITRGITKGIPSLFADLKSLYADKEKQAVVEAVVEAAREEYARDSPTIEPTNYLWTLYFLAQHYSYISQPSKALSLLDTALTHTPTLPELHLCKARVLKRSGDLFGAARCLNDARLLDGQDRFLNTKCGKYLLRAGMIEEANVIFAMFTKVSKCIEHTLLLHRTHGASLFTRKMPSVQP